MPVSILGLLKPCYIFRPSALFHRIKLAISNPSAPGPVEIKLPWGACMTANSGDAIGRALETQGIFDIAVSECAWRLLDPNARVIDAGANIGYMTLLFASKTGPHGDIHSFEPHPKIRETLNSNVGKFLGKHSSEHIHVYEYALGSEESVCQLEEPDDFAHNQGTAAIATATASVSHPGRTSYSVPVKPLDSLFENQSIDLLKIDVEGYEKEVLTGASRMLKEHKVRHIIYEDHNKDQSGIHRTLIAQGYHVFSIGYTFFGPLLLPWDRQLSIHESWESASFLATLHPEDCLKRLGKRGWQVLKDSSTRHG